MSPTMMVAMTIRISRPRRPILGTGERTTTSSVTPLPVPPCYALAAPPRVTRSPSVLAYEVSTVHHRPVGTDCPHRHRFPGAVLPPQSYLVHTGATSRITAAAARRADPAARPAHHRAC